MNSAKFITSSFMSINPFTFLPTCDTFKEYLLTIYAQMDSIFMFDLAVTSSIKSLIANFALYDNMFKICLLFTKSQPLIVLKIFLSVSHGTKTLFLSYFLGCLKITIRLLSIRNFKNLCSSGSKRLPD